MNIKQTIKGLIIGVIAMASLSFAILTPVLVAADCGGVKTSIVNCDQKGICPGGENPYEGSDPKGASPQTADYNTKYKHDYGKCADGKAPDSTIQNSGVWGLLLIVINILTAGVGIAAVGGIIYGSIMYTAAEGSADKVSKARAIITNVVIGLIAYALMFSLLNFIIPGGLFN